MTPETPQLQAVTAIGGPIVEEPSSYEFPPPSPPRPVRHRQRRASSTTLAPGERSPSIPEDGPISFPERIKKRMRSTTLFDSWQKRGSHVKQASVSSVGTSSTVVVEVPEELEPTFDVVYTITAEYLMKRRYERTYHQYVVAIVQVVQRLHDADLFHEALLNTQTRYPPG